MSLSLSIDRTSLALSALTLSGSAPAGDGIVIASLGRPAFQARLVQAPPSDVMPGRVTLGAVKDQGTLPLTVHVLASSSASRASLEQELEEALFQFAYDVTLTIDGSAQTFAADPCVPQWGDLLYGDVRQFTSTASIVIPVNPPGA